MKILVLTRYSSLGSSSRYRFYKYIPYLQPKGFDFTIHTLLGDKYINHLYCKTRLPFYEIIKEYLQRIFILLTKNRYDIIWLQQEAFPWIPAIFEKALLKTNIPIVVDYDDAFFHRYDRHNSKIVRFFLKNKIDQIMSISNVVVAGNQYLADRALKNKSKKVVILPTVIDINLYQTRFQSEEKLFTIGWIGSPHNAKYITTIQCALKEMSYYGDVKVILVGSGEIILEGLPLEIKEWNESTEVEEILNFDVGIMPLEDNYWERGKCGFKLIQYMACGIPVIASPVGVNTQIVKHGVNGFLAGNDNEWIKYLLILKNDEKLRTEMGRNGRKLVEENYTLQIIAPQLEQIFRDVQV